MTAVTMARATTRALYKVWAERTTLPPAHHRPRPQNTQDMPPHFSHLDRISVELLTNNPNRHPRRLPNGLEFIWK